MIDIVFWTSLFLVIYAWVGYIVVLYLLNIIFANRCEERNYFDNTIADFIPMVTIIIPAFNEATVIKKRLQNIINLNYPKEFLEIIVASDGSTDDTVEIAKQFANCGVQVIDYKENRGRADVHNDTIKIAKGDLIILTDSDTIFDNEFIYNIIIPFRDIKVGATIGNLTYNKNNSIVNHAEVYYYNNIDIVVRRLENNIGLVSNGTGAAMAIRKALFKALRPFDDVDTATIIDIILQNYKVVFIETAIAHDNSPQTLKGELSYRIRGTSKTITSIMSKISILRLINYPRLFFSVLSHRILKYLSPFFLITIFLTNIYLLNNNSLYYLLFYLQVILYLMLLIGGTTLIIGVKVPIFSKIFILGIAMYGMMVGVIKAILGMTPSSYKMVD